MPRDEIHAPFPVGLLAHSHDWKSPGSTPHQNVTNNLRTLDEELVQHPRESLDFLCVADLGFWSTVRAPYIPTNQAESLTSEAAPRPRGTALSAVTHTRGNGIYTPVASLIIKLLIRLSFTDPAIEPLARSLQHTGTPSLYGKDARQWPIRKIFSPVAIDQLPRPPFTPGSEPVF
jgi:hypothetical protein